MKVGDVLDIIFKVRVENKKFTKIYEHQKHRIAFRGSSGYILILVF